MKTIRFGIVGQYQSGKSLLINCLLQRSIATVGAGNATTHTVVNYLFSEKEYVEFFDDKGKHNLPIGELKRIDTIPAISIVNVYINNPLLLHYTLTDMPGLGFNDEDNEAAIKAIANIDYAIVVAPNFKSIGGSTSSSYKDILVLGRYGIPYYFILNCVASTQDKWNPTDAYNENIAVENGRIIDFYKPLTFPFEDKFIPIVNLMWYWYSIHENDDELLSRQENQIRISEYELDSIEISKEEIEQASNFDYIKQIFNMENRQYLELLKEIKMIKDEICPIGTIQSFAFSSIPENWMICDGRSLSISEYPLLYDAIGETFGSASVDDFKLPNLCGRFIRGWDSTGEIDKERKFGSEQSDAFQGHGHTLKIDGKLSDEGSHSHSLYYQKNTIKYGKNTFSDDYESLLMRRPVTWSIYYDEKYGKYNWNKESYDSHSLDTGGSHTHNLPTMTVIEPISINNGFVTPQNETRPQNIALLFCIRYK